MNQPVSRSRIGFAVLLIFFGLFLLLDRLELYDFGELVSIWWPLSLIYLGLIKLSSNRASSAWSIIFILLGLVFILNNLNVFDNYFLYTYWPILLLLAGVLMIINAFRTKKRDDNDLNKPFQTETLETNTIYVDAILTGNVQAFRSENFQGGQITCVLGGGEIDLLQCDIKGVATLDITCVLGGCEIRVPQDWNILFKGSPILGGFTDSRKSSMIDTNKTLEIKGLVLLGGFEIK